MAKFDSFSIIADGWLPLRSSEGLSSSLLMCSVISDHLRVGSRLQNVIPSGVPVCFLFSFFEFVIGNLMATTRLKKVGRGQQRLEK